ncbi:septation inhibitor protein [Bifidobacterium dolichotidis]|uniref:Cell division protein CrgA n=1 Tax=Bifidobacterium dolichotidis TaxID=2306976 RepID=A0A430FQZ0_9BIFI|nr:cell division protein CrgA [Bifidobacterium dolichotidis]RSX55236.1 septation inhibitor protein [Bifidobacterium dolichotidis]
MADEKLHETAADVQEDAVTKQATEGAVAQEEPNTATTHVVDDEAPEADKSASLDEDVIAESTKVAEEVDDASDTADAEDDDLDVPMDKVEAVLSASLDSKDVTPQMARVMRRQTENTRRVEESIKDTKANPRWLVPTFCALMIIGLIWAVVYYINSGYPIPGIGAWNLAIALGLIIIGFLMTMAWH